jgi:phosphopantothenoylcysteine decarboxylase/phosphopantothenate--cysteine ligase
MRVTVGISGGIAAYKAAEVVRALQRQALEVHVVMTAAAGKFVQPLTFAALTGHKVITSLWDEWDTGVGSAPSQQSGIEHIGEAQWADALVVAPATANILAKFAHGIADDFLTTMYLATAAPVLVAPAMNVNMWEHPATQANLEILRQRGVRIVEPGTGELACGMVGAGRMAEPEAIADAATTWPAKSCWSLPPARARRWTRSAFWATAPAARWATRWPRPRRAAARR